MSNRVEEKYKAKPTATSPCSLVIEALLRIIKNCDDPVAYNPAYIKGLAERALSLLEAYAACANVTTPQEPLTCDFKGWRLAQSKEEWSDCLTDHNWLELDMFVAEFMRNVPATPQEPSVSPPVRMSARELAERIVDRVADDAINLAVARHDMEWDSDLEITLAEIVADVVNCLTGEDIGCGPEESADDPKTCAAAYVQEQLEAYAKSPASKSESALQRAKEGQ